MGLFKNFQIYRRILRVLLVLNIFIVICGFAALFQYFQTHDAALSTIITVAVATLIFGFILPLFVMSRLKKLADEMRREVEKSVARLLSGWMENYRNSEDPMHDPHFWLNIALILVEIFGPKFQHPLAKIMADFAPLMKTELKKNNDDVPARKARSRKNIN